MIKRGDDMSDELAMDSGALIFATLADVYLSSGMVDEAISILKDGLSRNPTYTLAKLMLGRAYYMKGDIKEAVKILEGIYDDARGSENTNLYLGHCYKKLGEVDKAIKYYELTCKINPENKEAKQGLEVLKPKSVKIEKVKIEKRPEPVKIEEAKVEKMPEPIMVEKIKVEKAPEPVKIEEAKVEKMPELAKIEMEKVEEPLEFEIPLEPLRKPVNRLLSIKAVKGAFICSKDGLLIENYYKDRTDIEEICAMIAAIHNEVEESFKYLNEGCVDKFTIEKEDETVCVITAGASLFTVVTQSGTNPGLVFVYARKIIDEIMGVLG
jgi:predicted regulator of Ras-like GTPase activity (Roadblock/LC7/MglB family)